MVEFSTQKSADGRDGVDSADGKMVSMMVTSISGEMDGVEQKHFFLAKHHGEMRNRINLPTIKMIKKALVYGTVRTTGKHKHTGCFNYVQEFCRAVSVVAPKYFKMEKSKETVTLNLRKPPALLFGTNSTPNSTGANEKAGNNDKEADVTRHGVKALALSIAPESFYDVVMRAALDKDFRDFNGQGIECRVQSQHLHPEVTKNKTANAPFLLNLSPDTAVFSPNVGPSYEELGVDSGVSKGEGDTKHIDINGLRCAYQVFAAKEVDDDGQKINKKRWQIDVPGLSVVNNLAKELPEKKDRDLKIGSFKGDTRVELRTKNLTRTAMPESWSDVTQEEKHPTNKKGDKGDVFSFPVGFHVDSQNLTVEQMDGRLTFEVFNEQDEE